MKNTTAQPADQAAPRRRRRRRRRNASQVLAARTIGEIKAKKRQFLKDVGAILTDALGFTVKVSLSTPSTVPADATPAMRKAARMPAATARRQIADSMHAPIVPGSRTLPTTRHRDGSITFNVPSPIGTKAKRRSRKKQAGIPGLDDDVGL